MLVWQAVFVDFWELKLHLVLIFIAEIMAESKISAADKRDCGSLHGFIPRYAGTYTASKGSNQIFQKLRRKVPNDG